MRRLLNVVAARMATMAVVQSIASDIEMPRPTLSRYLDLLELVFVIRRIPAWSSNLTTRATAAVCGTCHAASAAGSKPGWFSTREAKRCHSASKCGQAGAGQDMGQQRSELCQVAGCLGSSGSTAMIRAAAAGTFPP
jgi:hypothetical protein